MTKRRSAQVSMSLTAEELAGQELIYVFQLGGNGPIKIGYTTDLPKRIANMRATLPYEVIVRAVFLAGRDAEQDLLQDLEEFQIRGEWFHDHPEVWRAINKLPRVETSVFGDKVARWQHRMPAAEAETYWRDMSLTTKQAIKKMWGWTDLRAWRAFGARGATRLTSREARERGKKGGAVRRERSIRGRWADPSTEPLKEKLRVVWKSRSYANDQKAADAVNAMLLDMGLPTMGAWRTIRDILGKRT